MLLKWIGGKVQMAPWLHQRMPDHERYYEVFFGAGGFFWGKPLAKRANVINDLNGKLVNMYRTISREDSMKQLLQCFDNAIYSRELFLAFQTLYDDQSGLKWLELGSEIKVFGDKFKPSVQRAFVYIYLNRCSFNGQFQSFAHRADSSPILNLEEDIKRMFWKLNEGKVVVENLGYDDFLAKVPDEKDVFIYLDPPYIITTETQGSDYYEKVMKLEQHTDLRNMLYKFKNAKWMLSYDDHEKVKELYQDTATKPIFTIQTPKINQSSANYSSSSAGTDSVYKQELLITNYDTDKIGGLFGTGT